MLVWYVFFGFTFVWGLILWFWLEKGFTNKHLPVPEFHRPHLTMCGCDMQPRRPSTLTLALIRRWTHLIPPLTPHSPFVPANSCPDPNIDPQVDQAYSAPHSSLPHPPPHPCPSPPWFWLWYIQDKLTVPNMLLASEDIKQKQNERTN